jgi:hypothetical protein
MAAGPLVAAQAQSTTTTTGTGPLTIVNTVPLSAPQGSTTFQQAFAPFTAANPTGLFPVSNVFYAIIDASSNIEAGYGTLTSATNLTRDFVIFSGIASTTVPYVPGFVATATASFLNLATGTASVYSNPNLLSQMSAYQARFPNFTSLGLSGNSVGGFTDDIMQGSFGGVLTDGVGTTAATINYKVSSAGVVQFFLPTATVNNTGTTLAITGVPSYLSNVTTQSVSALVTGTAAGGVTVPGIATLAGGATPTSTGTLTFQQYTGTSFPGVFTPTFTASVVRGTIAQVLTFTLH